MGAAPFRGTFSPSARGEGKMGAPPFFPLAPRQRGEGARRAGEGWLSLQRSSAHPPLRAPSPRQHGLGPRGGGKSFRPAGRDGIAALLSSWIQTGDS